jgi:predicted Na+-dependent transporter
MSHVHLDLIPALVILLMVAPSVIRRKPTVWGKWRLGILGGLAVLTLLLLLLDALSTAELWPADLRAGGVMAAVAVSGAVSLAIASVIRGWVVLGVSSESAWASIDRVAKSLLIPVELTPPRASLMNSAATATVRGLPMGALWIGLSGELQTAKMLLFRKVLRKFLRYGAPTFAR